MTGPDKSKRGWLDRLRTTREEHKRREAERAYRNLGGKGGGGGARSRAPDGVGGGTGGPASGGPPTA